MSGRDLIVGTAGHIDHGKTALVRALTGVDTDRLPVESRDPLRSRPNDRQQLCDQVDWGC